MNKAIISAPFGTYVRLPGCTSTRGTYTHNPRPGAIWGALTRIYFTKEGVVNNMGLRNPGISTQDFKKHRDAIWSVSGETYSEWVRALSYIPYGATVELNLSCPNVDWQLTQTQLTRLLYLTKKWFGDNVIIKYPSDICQATRIYARASEVGIRMHHACNTVKTSRGGLSGRETQKYSLPLIKLFHREQEPVIIGGGGIYTPDDVKRYRDAGADHFALGTILFTPWRVPAVLKEINR